MLRAALLSVAAMAAFAAPAWAGESVCGDGVEVLDEAALAAHRGGFEVSGITINFAATITTYIEGVPALTTQLTWTDAGAIIEETIGEVGESLGDLTPDQLAALGIDPAQSGGIVIVDASGVTEIVHNVTEGTLQSIIINTASGRDILQEIDVTLELPGFELVQQDLIVERLGYRILEDLHGVMFFDPGG